MKSRPFSFSSARELRTRIELLPSPPRWKADEIEVEGGDTKDLLTLYYRDGLECFKFLLANPLFAEYMDFNPRHEYAAADGSERLYNEIMTGNLAWTLQVRRLSSHFQRIIRSYLCPRTPLDLERLWDWSFLALIKHTSQLVKVIKNATLFTSPAET